MAAAKAAYSPLTAFSGLETSSFSSLLGGPKVSVLPVPSCLSSSLPATARTQQCSDVRGPISIAAVAAAAAVAAQRSRQASLSGCSTAPASAPSAPRSASTPGSAAPRSLRQHEAAPDASPFFMSLAPCKASGAERFSRKRHVGMGVGRCSCNRLGEQPRRCNPVVLLQPYRVEHAHRMACSTTVGLRGLSAATCIQKYWRMFRVRKLYLRLMDRARAELPHTAVAGASTSARPQLAYLAEPPISLFTQYGNPHAYHEYIRRVWFLPLHPRNPCMRIRVPRPEADVPLSEVERILAGGFWKDAQPTANASQSEGLSMYMQQKLKQEEREAEEALQMLSYEPAPDFVHRLGSFKQQSMDLVKSIGKSITGTLTHMSTSGQQRAGFALLHHADSLPSQGSTSSVGPGPGTSSRFWGSDAAPAPDLLLRVPLLHTLDADEHHSVLAQQRIPIAVNPQRLRSRSMVARMSL